MYFFEVFRAEAKAIFSDAAIVLTIIGGVILYAFLYPQPYLKEAVSGLGVVVIDEDKSDMSRQMKFMIEATPEIHIIKEVPSLLDARKLLVQGEAKGIIVLKHDFKRDVLLGHQPRVAIAADASYFLILGAILKGASKAILTESATLKITKLMLSSEPLANAKKEYTPYTLESMNLFNPHNSYTQYVIPAVFIIILQQTMLIGLGILGGHDNESPSDYSDNAPIWMRISARVSIFMALFMVHFLFYFGLCFEYYEVLHLASIADLLTLGFAFLLSSALLGVTLGALFPNREMATPLILFSSLPLVFSAGFVWPIEALPQWIVTLSLFFPSAPAIQGFLKINQMGTSFDAILVQYGVLWLQIFVYGLLSYLLLKAKKDARGTLKTL